MSDIVNTSGAMEHDLVEETQVEETVSVEQTNAVEEIPTEEESEADKTMKALEAIPDLLAEVKHMIWIFVTCINIYYSWSKIINAMIYTLL
jgi:hypothetical protein